MLKKLVRLVRFRTNIRRGLNSAKPINPTDIAVVAALKNSIRNASREERVLFAPIEQRRVDLLSNSSQIEIVDFGAGQADHQADAAAQHAGVKHKTTIAKVAAASKREPWAQMLYQLARQTRPLSVIEMGSCVGISGSYLGLALMANGAGHLVSLEGDPATASLARETIEVAGLSDIVAVNTGPFHETLQDALAKSAPVDMVFIDGHHDKDATLTYFETVIPFLSSNAVLIFDDVKWSDGMHKAWMEIIGNEKVSFAVDLGEMGIVVIA